LPPDIPVEEVNQDSPRREEGKKKKKKGGERECLPSGRVCSTKKGKKKVLGLLWWGWVD